MLINSLSRKNKQGGFTLIELMVVMAIIAILATAGLSAYTGYLRKARDMRRVTDLRQIAQALELYFIDHNQYPVNTSWWNSYQSSWQANLGQTLKPYLDNLPNDPLNNATDGPWATPSKGFSYAYGRTDIAGSRYNLVAQFEDANHPLKCGLKNYIFFYGEGLSVNWCGSYNVNLYAANPQVF